MNTPNTPRRRLSAILHADLAGFVRLTEGEEELTFRNLKSVKSDVWRPAVEIAGGSIVHGTGDAMLAEFGSALAAAPAARDIQERLGPPTELLAEAPKLRCRIGSHLGDGMVTGRNPTPVVAADK